MAKIAIDAGRSRSCDRHISNCRYGNCDNNSDQFHFDCTKSCRKRISMNRIHWLFRIQSSMSSIYPCNCSPHALHNFSKLHAAFAGLVDGNLLAFMPVLLSAYLQYSSYAFVPFTKIFSILEFCTISVKSFTITSLIELSLDPLIIQLAITSQTAI